MPTPAKTSRAAVIAIACDLVAAHGAEALTVAAVAQRAGVRAPSLYKHFADRSALLKAVEIAVLDELEAALRAGTAGSTPQQRLVAMAAAYRTFARAQPKRYGIIYSRNAADDAELAAACRRLAMPLFEELAAAGVAPAEVHSLARTVVAFLHGFVAIEIVGAFRLGGDLDRDFAEGLARILPG